MRREKRMRTARGEPRAGDLVGDHPKRGTHMKLSKPMATALAAFVLLPAGAFAATIAGTPDNERLIGTRYADQIDGNQGNDRIFGLDGNDLLVGGAGNDVLRGARGDDELRGDAPLVGDRTSFDRLFGGAGNDTLRGGDSRDRMDGGRGNDTSFGQQGRDILFGGLGDDVQDGGGGNDVLSAGRGVDVENGGEGNDVLRAAAPRDVHPGNDQVGDTLDGGAGDDRFRTRDGEVDRITCGPGFDRAFLDGRDVISDSSAQAPKGSCERVVRRPAR